MGPQVYNIFPFPIYLSQSQYKGEIKCHNKEHRNPTQRVSIGIMDDQGM